ncbi:DNA (cytosine-5-)-methyltransferase [Iodidimonas nitroreducens]|uniref:Cytosine-specific methyltransferase n=1 Tax=Iodidimonas nitroreducens TaxID=1236968 RepID=A0A5A7NB69_9PROT|nr:modification methylase HhaI [alpha proteobacterium Q-1]GER05643.1 DNA (cytosine-5-)-methyltransferase [Iodidimonas nitroreducens]
MPNFYEFFAGGGMARAGLGSSWECLFANDFDRKKGEIYEANWGRGALTVGDVKKVEAKDLPSQADLVWGSFPCQDLSLAGGGAGLKGERSGTFWPFWRLMQSLIREGRAPSIIVLENVCGALTSHQGKDFAAICAAFARENYRCGAMIIDAANFVPQSRPRLFIIGIRGDVILPDGVIASGPTRGWHTQGLCNAHAKLSPKAKSSWLWWTMPTPPVRNSHFADLIEDNPKSVSWHTAAETKQLISMMSEVNLEKVKAAKNAGRRMVGAIYKRTRHDETGAKVQRAEIRFDEVAGCLRTPAGGSSRQLIMVVDGDKVKSRLISTRETARLMGLPDDYVLPARYNEAYHLTGDGVVVPVVRYLAVHIFEPVLKAQTRDMEEAA